MNAVRFEVVWQEDVDLWHATAFDKNGENLGTGSGGSAMGAIETWSMLAEELAGVEDEEIVEWMKKLSTKDFYSLSEEHKILWRAYFITMVKGS